MRLITDCVYIHKKNSFPVTYLNITHDIRSPSRLLLDKTRYLIISVSNPRLTEASRVRHGWLVTQFPARDPILMHVPLEELRRCCLSNRTFPSEKKKKKQLFEKPLTLARDGSFSRTGTLRQSEELPGAEGLPQEGTVPDGGRVDPAHAELRGVHQEGQRVQQQGAVQLCHPRVAEEIREGRGRSDFSNLLR